MLVLESVNGGELFDYLSKNHLQIAQREWLVRRIFGELANAVGWMHAINLTHRDIKLENIILTTDLCALQPLTPSRLPPGPLLKLSDFGLSRFIDPSSPLLETRCGSEEYAAPELIMGKKYDGRKTDVWALGVVLYALLSGILPFLDDSSSNQTAIDSPSVQREMAGDQQRDAKARKAHLLKIAKGDLRWPSLTNDDCRDQVQLPSCPPTHRLITPSARLLVAKLLRRDAEKRSTAWDVWNESWMMQGSIPNETSMMNDTFTLPLDPRSSVGQAWIHQHAQILRGASAVVHKD